jgi:hypothetical protein
MEAMLMAISARDMPKAIFILPTKSKLVPALISSMRCSSVREMASGVLSAQVHT